MFTFNDGHCSLPEGIDQSQSIFRDFANLEKMINIFSFTSPRMQKGNFEIKIAFECIINQHLNISENI